MASNILASLLSSSAQAAGNASASADAAMRTAASTAKQKSPEQLAFEKIATEMVKSGDVEGLQRIADHGPKYGFPNMQLLVDAAGGDERLKQQRMEKATQGGLLGFVGQILGGASGNSIPNQSPSNPVQMPPISTGGNSATTPPVTTTPLVSPTPSATNPGNMRPPGQSTGFASFSSPEDGIAAVTRQLKIYGNRDGLNTIEGIMNKYSPSSENDTPGIIKNISQFTGFKPNQPLNMNDPATLHVLTGAILRQEGAFNGKKSTPSTPGSNVVIDGKPAISPAVNVPEGMNIHIDTSDLSKIGVSFSAPPKGDFEKFKNDLQVLQSQGILTASEYQAAIDFKKNSLTGRTATHMEKTEDKINGTTILGFYDSNGKLVSSTTAKTDLTNEEKQKQATEQKQTGATTGTTQSGKPFVTTYGPNQPIQTTIGDTQVAKNAEYDKLPETEARKFQDFKVVNDQINDVKKFVDPSNKDGLAKYGVSLEDLSGPITARVENIKSKLVGTPAYTQMQTKLSELRPIIYALSGKAINEQENKWLTDEILPTLKQPPENFFARLGEFENWVKRNRISMAAMAQEQGYRPVLSNDIQSEVDSYTKKGGGGVIPNSSSNQKEDRYKKYGLKPEF